jgi:hypothetical protein
VRDSALELTVQFIEPAYDTCDNGEFRTSVIVVIRILTTYLLIISGTLGPVLVVVKTTLTCLVLVGVYSLCIIVATKVNNIARA